MHEKPTCQPCRPRGSNNKAFTARSWQHASSPRSQRGLSSAANRAPSDLWPMPQGECRSLYSSAATAHGGVPAPSRHSGAAPAGSGSQRKSPDRVNSQGFKKGAVRVWPRQLKAASAQSRAGPASATPIKWARMKVRQGHASSTTTSRPERTAKPSYPMVRSRG